MSKFSNTIEYSLRTTLDASGIAHLQSQIAAVSTQLEQLSSKKLIGKDQLQEAQSDLKTLQKALSSSFNSQTGMLNLKDFQNQLKNLSFSQLEQSMSRVGSTGKQTFGNIISQVGQMDTSFKSISSTADKIFNTMGNTVRWGITASIFQEIQNSLYRAVDYIKELDTSLNNIRIVTGASNADMRDFAAYANESAQAIGSSTIAFTNAAQLYAQNGFNEDDYTRLAEITTKVANVTQQDTATVSEQITALMEGYHMSIDQVENSLGGMAVVAAASAADLEELATAEQKVASTANSLGVSHEQLTAQIGTIVSVTRQAPESVGNAMRTLYARIADLQMGETLEDGTTLGNLSGTLEKFGIQILNEEGNLRNLGDILEDLQEKWSDLSNAQQIALGTKLAGKYQLNPFMALMENADMYNEQLEMMQTSQGALDEQQAIYMDSLQAKIQQLATAGEGLVNSLFNTDAIKPLITDLTELINLVQAFAESIGGLNSILTAIGSLGAKVFSNQIGQSISNIMTNIQRNRSRSNISSEEVQRLLNNLGAVGKASGHTASANLVSQVLPLQNKMSQEQREQYNKILQDTVKLENQVITSKEKQVQAQQELSRAAKDNYNINKAINKDGSVTGRLRNLTELNRSQSEKALQYLTKDFNTNARMQSILDTSSRGATTKVRNNMKQLRKDVQGLNIDLSKVENAAGLFNSKMSSQDKISAVQNLQRALKDLEGQLNTIHKNAVNTQGLESNVDVAMQDMSRVQQLLKTQQEVAAQESLNMQQQSYVQQITMAAGSIGQLIFAWQSFQSLGELISSDDISSTEKLNQVLMNLAFTLPMLIDGFKGFVEGASGLKGLFTNFIAARNGLGADEILELGGSLQALSSTSAIAGQSIKLLGIEFSGLSAALISTLGPFAAVAAAIAAVVGAATLAYQEYTKDARAAQEAADITQESAAALQAAQSEYDNLQSNISSYHEAAQAMHALTEGTNEWKDAVAATNEQVLNLLETYPELAKYIRRGTGGSLSVTDEGFGELNRAIEKQVNQLQFADSVAQNSASQAQLQADRTDLLRSISWLEENINGTSGENDVRYTHLDSAQLDSVLALIRSQGEQSLQSDEAIATALGVDVGDPIVSAIQSNTDRIIAFNSQQATNAAAERIRSESAIQQMLNSQEGYNPDNPYNNAIVAAISNASDADSEAYKEALTEVKGITSFSELLRQYQNLTGDSYSEVQDNWGTDDSAQFTTASGQSYTVSRQEIESALAAAQVINSTIANWSDYYDLAQSISSTDLSRRYSELPSVLLTGNNKTGFDYSSLTDMELSNIAYGDITPETLGITDEIAQDAGFADGQAYANAFVEGAQNELSGRDWSDHYSDDEIAGFLQGNEIEEEDYNNYVDELRDSLGTSEGTLTVDYDNAESHLAELQKEQSLVDENSKEYQDYQDEIEAVEKQLSQYDETLNDIAVDTIKMQKGLKELGTVLDDNSDIILNGDKNSQRYADAVNEVRDSLAKVLTVDPGSLSDKFISTAENLDLMREAANGSADALAQLRANFAEDYIANVKLSGVAPEDEKALRGELQTLAATLPDVEVGASIDDTPFIEALNNMIASSQLSVAQVNELLSGMGYDVSVDYVPVEVPDIKYSLDEQLSRVGSSDGNGIVAGVKAAVSAIASTTSKMVPMPKIHATKRGGGSSGWSPVKSTGGTGGGGGGGGSGGGGGGGRPKSGGGGGSGTKYEPKEKDKVEDELDRYERVNAELDTLANNLDIIAEEQDRLVGNDMAKNMAKQIANIKEQVYWQEKKLKIQKEEASEYRRELSRDYGIRFDDEGHITNYATKYKQLLNNLNNLIAQYNRTTTESGQEALEKRIESAQEEFDNYNDLIEKYDELISSSIIESEKAIEDFYDQIEDLQIEAFETAVEAADNLKDLQESIIDFNAIFSGLDSDSPYRDMMTAFENLKTYWDIGKESMDDYYDELIARNNEAMKHASKQEKANLQYQNALLERARQQYGQGTFEEGGTGLFDLMIHNVNTMLDQMEQFNSTGTASIFGENSNAIYEVAQDIFDSAVEMAEDYEGHIDDLRDAILDAIDEIGDAMDERLEMYENINDELDHYMSIIEMVQGEQAYESLNEALSATVNNSKASIKEMQENIKVLIDLRDAMQEGSEEWKEVNELITDQQEELLETTEDTLDLMVQRYENAMNQVLDNWIGSTGMGDDLDWISEEWELINRNADYYLDDVNAAYEIQKLQGKYLDLLDNSNQLDIQNQITQQMQQQLGYLREKEKLSEYDVQYANAQLEILQKQIALQEAQRNKSQLQLRRDNQGNYSYVYTADEDETRSAQNDLLDAQNNAYNLSKDQMKQTQDDSLSALQDARDMLEQIWTNANLTLEEKTKRTQTIIDSLKEYLAGTSEQLSESEKNIINDFIGMCDILTDENDQRLQDVYEQIVAGNNDAFDQIDTRWQTSITNWLQNMEDFNLSTDEAFDNLVNNFEDYQSTADELGDLVGMTFDDMSDTIQNTVDKTNDLANSTADFINQLKNDAGTVKEYEDRLASMTEKIQDAENGMRAYQEQVNKLQQELTAQQQENSNLQQQVANLTNELNGGGSGSGSGGGGGSGNGSGGSAGKADSETAWGIAQAIWTYGQRSGWGNDPIRSGKLTKAYGSAFAKQVQSIINQNYRSGKLVNFNSMKYSSYNLIGYRTGGYTGEWNNTDGKLGVLHEKELVLNKTDTENILNAVDMVRNMTAMARDGAYSNVIHQSNGIIDMASLAANMPEEFGSTVTYQVECTFPNATSVDEIQQAILTLPDIAPQYAYKY